MRRGPTGHFCTHNDERSSDSQPRSGRRYQPFDFRHPDAVATDEFEPPPDVDARRNEFRILTWDLARLRQLSMNYVDFHFFPRSK